MRTIIACTIVKVAGGYEWEVTLSSDTAESNKVSGTAPTIEEAEKAMRKAKEENQ